MGDANIIGDQTDFLDLRNPNNRGHTLFKIFHDQLSAFAFSELLRHYGVDVSDKGISKWEKGQKTATSPTANVSGSMGSAYTRLPTGNDGSIDPDTMA